MSVYYGVVENNRVVLEGDAPLADGLAVEVRPRIRDADEGAAATSERAPTDEPRTKGAATEEDFKRRLRATGASAPVAPPHPTPMTPERRLIEVTGQPLSEQIIMPGVDYPIYTLYGNEAAAQQLLDALAATEVVARTVQQGQ